MLSDRTANRPRPKLRRYAVVHVILAAMFLLGVPLWNRVNPRIVGLPFSVFVTALLLPALFVVNMVQYVRSHWAEDMLASRDMSRPAGQAAVGEGQKE